MSEELDKRITTVPYSKFELTREQIQELTIQQLEEFNEVFWEQQSVNLHKCYRKGQAYANNTNKKDSVDLLHDMLNLLKQQYKNSDKNDNIVDNLFENIVCSLKILKQVQSDVDKDCILSIIQGYTLGCLKKYEKK